MWAIFKVNVLFALKFHRFGNDMDGLAELFAKEYDACIKRGGDMMYGVPVINGNVVGMADAIKRAFRKGQQSDGENFNLLAEIYPSAFDAYWMGAEMAPYPNPILKPLGWSMTPPAPGAIRNIGPNPIMLGMSTARHKAEVSALQLLVDDLKNQTVNISPLGEVNVYETLQKVLKNEITDSKIKNHPAIKIAKGIINKHKQAKNKKPSIGTQFKKSIKFPFPELPKRKELIAKAKNKLLEQAVDEIKKQLSISIEEALLQPIISNVQTAVELSTTIPNPKPSSKQIKQYVKDLINGVPPTLSLPTITIPTLPSREELSKKIEEKLPSSDTIKSMASDMIKDKIPQIPNVFFVPPTYKLTNQSNILIDPFINVAKVHLLGVSGTISVMAQYPPPAPPAPSVIKWTGYTIKG